MILDVPRAETTSPDQTLIDEGVDAHGYRALLMGAVPRLKSPWVLFPVPPPSKLQYTRPAPTKIRAENISREKPPPLLRVAPLVPSRCWLSSVRTKASTWSWPQAAALDKRPSKASLPPRAKLLASTMGPRGHRQSLA